MKRFFSSVLSVLMLAAVGCGETFDDSLLWEKINDHEKRIALLEELCKQMNTNISALQTIVTALQDNDYVTGVAPITKEGETIGYTITFSKFDPITIYHGKDGHTPQIGVKPDTDNIYYWTLDGDWLLDDSGNKIQAQGITPKLKVEDDYWYISYDNGATWEQLGKATGEDGDSFFKNVTANDDYVIFTFADGTELTVPRTAPVSGNKIYYTTSDGKKIFPNTTAPTKFGAILISNVYKDGQGVLTFDDTVTEIADSLFYRHETLTSITIPSGVTKIGCRAFFGCTSLTSAIVCNDVTTSNSVTEIGHNAFHGCSSLTSVTIGDSVTKIGYYAFYYCSSLTSVTIGNSVTEIGHNAFSGCSRLTSVTIPNSVTLIADRAFADCKSLTSVTIGDNITRIERFPFENCPLLTDIYVNINDLATYCKINNSSSIPGNKHLLVNGSEITELVIPDSVTEIGGNAFSGCSNLPSITIPDSVTKIGEYAFYGCSLTSVTIGDSVTKIGSSAFRSCRSLTSVTIPDSVTEIGIWAFDGCSSLKEVYCKPTTPPAGDGDMFKHNASDRKIYVPRNSVNAYKSKKYWSDYAYYIVGCDFE